MSSQIVNITNDNKKLISFIWASSELVLGTAVLFSLCLSALSLFSQKYTENYPFIPFGIITLINLYFALMFLFKDNTLLKNPTYDGKDVSKIIPGLIIFFCSGFFLWYALLFMSYQGDTIEEFYFQAFNTWWITTAYMLLWDHGNKTGNTYDN